MSSSQGRTQWPQKTDISGTGNTVGHNNHTMVVPVTVNVSIHAAGYLTPLENDLLNNYRTTTEAGRRTIERAVNRAVRLIKSGS